MIILEKNDDSQPPPLKVGLTYNLKSDNTSEEQAEFDSPHTIEAIKDAIQKQGFEVIMLEADKSLPQKLLDNQIDIVFNIAEGTNGRGREAHVPSILSYYGIKHTGSDETTLCVCLDKELAKRILVSHKVKTPKYQLIISRDFKLRKNLSFPLIAKPNAEGSSKGISEISIFKNENELKKFAESYFGRQSDILLLEEYITGREFTVGVVGNAKETRVFRPMEIAFKDKKTGYGLYDYTIKKDCMKYVDYICPPSISVDLEKTMMRTARKIYEALTCRDFARIDFMLTSENELYFIEINPLAGLTPGYSDFPMLAEANGVKYDELIGMILAAALKRYGMGGL